jgi:hypothetical protein
MNEQREKSGVLFKNDQKQPGETTPDYRGECKIDGKDWRISAWLKEGKTGKFFSFAFTPKDEPAKTTGATDQKLDDDAIPF